MPDTPPVTLNKETVFPSVPFSNGNQTSFPRDMAILPTGSITKLPKIVGNLLKVNGLRWTSLYFIYWAIRCFLKTDYHRLYRVLIRFEEKHDLPGFNTSSTAADIWDLLPWNKDLDEEWTVSPEWKQSLVKNILHKYIRPGTAVLEIGPGAGRWTKILQPAARVLIAADVSEKAITICRNRLAGSTNTVFYHIRDSRLSFITDTTIDAIWSFDVFVHLNSDDTDRYLSEFKRVLAPGGIAVIHHPKDGGMHGGCRSRMTGRLFAALLQKNGLSLLRQFDSWGENGQYNLYRYRDCISVFHA